ncbi:hypothetical protein AB2T85_06790 [Clostridium butyricum]|uniref:hypothetical protein n=1 Tax=Clostridium butyricum TaxID=1492 RepID=UPI00346617CC
MDENRVLEKYMDKVDKDRRDQEGRMEKRFNLTMEAINSTHIKIEKLQDKLDEKNR